MEKFEGLVAAPFTPMNKDNSVNLELIPRYYELLKNNGISGAFVNGSTGEGVSLSQKEKMLVLQEWAKCYKNDKTVRIINLVGGTSYQECIENAVFSFEQGASAIALIAPFYFKPVSVNQLADFVALVAQSVPSLPVYFYHIPALTGVHFPMIDFLSVVTQKVRNFAGIKYTHEDFMDYLACLNFENGKYDILWGRDECMLSALVLGALGAVGSTFNYAAPLYHKLIETYNNGKITEARNYQLKAVNMVKLLNKYGGIAVGKAYMRYIGLDCGKFRSPVLNMNDMQYQKFLVDIEALEMNNLFSK